MLEALTGKKREGREKTDKSTDTHTAAGSFNLLLAKFRRVDGATRRVRSNSTLIDSDERVTRRIAPRSVLHKSTKLYRIVARRATTFINYPARLNPSRTKLNEGPPVPEKIASSAALSFLPPCWSVRPGKRYQRRVYPAIYGRRLK